MIAGQFDAAAHIIKLPGRGGKGPTDYLPVAARIAWFRADHPDGKLHVWKDQIDERIAIFHAQAETSDGAIAQGWGSETPQDFKDYIEKASTKAVGRALAALGYGTLQAGDELDEGARIVDTPKQQPTPRAVTTPGREPAPRSSPQRPTRSDRPAAVPSAAGPPSAVTPAEEARLMKRLDKVDAHYNADKGGGAETWKGEVDAMAAFRSYAIEHGVDGGPRFKEVVGRPMSDFPTWDERLGALQAAVGMAQATAEGLPFD
jgi:hypothetical protein